MLTDLSALAVPQIFNSSDILNAYNLLGLAQEHLGAGRYRDATVALSNAETTMTTHLADWHAAEAWARRRYGLDGNVVRVGRARQRMAMVTRRTSPGTRPSPCAGNLLFLDQAWC